MHVFGNYIKKKPIPIGGEILKPFYIMRRNNLFVGIAILLATTACTQGGYLGVNGEDIAATADNHHGDTD